MQKKLLIMKKLVLFLIAIIMMVPCVEADAQSKALIKERKKEYKAKMKEYKKEKWDLFGSSRTLEVALLTHYDKLNSLGDDGHEVVGIAVNFATKNTGKQMAINDACNTYAQEAGSHVKGRAVSDMAADAMNPDAEFYHFYAAYERAVAKEIKGEMQESYSIIREVGKNLYEMQVYYIVSESAASKARIRALENAAKESAAAQAYANKVSNFVREGFQE